MRNNFLLTVLAIPSKLSTKFQSLLLHWWWDWMFFSTDFIMALVKLWESLLDFLLFAVVPRIASSLEAQQVLPFLQFPWLWHSLTFLNKKSKNLLNCEIIQFYLTGCSFLQTLDSLCFPQPTENFVLEFKHPVVSTFEPCMCTIFLSPQLQVLILSRVKQS